MRALKALSASLALTGSIAAAFAGLAIAEESGGIVTPGEPAQTAQMDENLCKSVGGGEFVRIPGFPGEKIDVRLLPDVRWLVRKFDIFITDGYSMDPVHASNGEHPIGLAIDVVPDKSSGGSWRKVTRLAQMAEPRQNAPREPFRWVGYSGDANHGPHNHLHLSWMHSDTKPGNPARVVYTRICPPGEEAAEPVAG